MAESQQVCTISTLAARVRELESLNSQLKGVAEDEATEAGMQSLYARDLQAENARLRTALEKLWKHTPKIDNGHCAVCRHGYRSYDLKGNVSGKCSDTDCISHVVEAALSTAPVAEPLQSRVLPWLLECFGEAISNDKTERNHRFLEESLESVQSLGMTKQECLQLVDYVYGRPIGEPPQEVGGVMITLAALCIANGLDMHACGETELARVWGKVEVIRAKQAAKPKGSVLPVSEPQDEPLDPCTSPNCDCVIPCPASYRRASKDDPIRKALEMCVSVLESIQWSGWNGGWGRTLTASLAAAREALKAEGK